MLVLSRKKQESIVIDGHTTITILDCGRGGIRIGITAPADVRDERKITSPSHPRPLRERAV